MGTHPRCDRFRGGVADRTARQMADEEVSRCATGVTVNPCVAIGRVLKCRPAQPSIRQRAREFRSGAFLRRCSGGRAYVIRRLSEGGP